MTMITPSYLGETIEYSSLHACRSTLEDPTRDHGSNTLALAVIAQQASTVAPVSLVAEGNALGGVPITDVLPREEASPRTPLDSPSVPIGAAP